MLWIHRAQAAATAAVAAGVAVAGFAAAAPAVAGAAPRSAITSVPPASHTVKPVPVRPPSSPGVVTGGALPAKPRAARQAAPDIPDTGWTVSLAASPATLWPTQYSTLTATTNMDVGPTPYWIQIYDESTGSYVASCASGTSCSISVTEPTTSLQEYTAVVADGADSYPPGNEQAVSSVVAVDWQAIYVSLSASPTTVAVDYSTTLTATAPNAIVTVNGKPAEKTLLKNGDIITLGLVKIQFWLAPAPQRGLRLQENLVWALLIFITLGQLALIYIFRR